MGPCGPCVYGAIVEEPVSSKLLVGGKAVKRAVRTL
jgi:hypothetical protein